MTKGWFGRLMLCGYSSCRGAIRAPVCFVTLACCTPGLCFSSLTFEGCLPEGLQTGRWRYSKLVDAVLAIVDPLGRTLCSTDVKPISKVHTGGPQLFQTVHLLLLIALFQQGCSLLLEFMYPRVVSRVNNPFAGFCVLLLERFLPAF